METFLHIILVIAAYFLGSIPFGLLLTKHAGMGDVRKIGSGNIGATNVMRMGNKKIALATLLLDSLKGFIIVIIAKLVSAPNWTILLCAVLAVSGHIFPFWLEFKGGKGVATTIAVYWALSIPLGLFVSCAWLVLFTMTRISSFASIVSIILANVIAMYFGIKGMFFACLFISIMVVYKHKDNIKRILRGEEKTFSKNKNAEV